MDPVRRFALTLPAGPGHTAPAEIVVVHWTDAVVNGVPVYEDLSGTVRAVVTKEGLARLLDEGGEPAGPVLAAAALP